ncbi:MAG: hypothetical protein JW908_16795 [Anaerolineales bacterium]|nr:hypothetical protein [Anaerolineales bacterium]
MRQLTKKYVMIVLLVFGSLIFGAPNMPLLSAQGASHPALSPETFKPNTHEIAPKSADNWSDEFSPRGLSFDVYAAAVSGSDVYVGGGFIAAGNTQANYIARYNLTTKTWYPLGDGVEDAVYAILIDGDNVYVGGEGFVSRWNTTSQAWSQVGYINGSVRALVLDTNTLYAGGSFDYLSGAGGGGIITTGIASLNLTSGEWSALGDGLDDGVVYALALNGNSLYLGGSFSQAGGVSNTKLVAVWNTGTSLWSSLGAFPNDGTVYALALNGNELLAGGYYTSPSDVPVYRLTGSWQAMGSGVYDIIHTINVSTYGIYAAGNADILHWNGSSWDTVGAALNGPTSTDVYAMAYANSHLYVGGTFTAAGNVSAFRASDLNLTNSTWSPLFNESGPGGMGLDGDVYAILIDGSDVYVGGEFSRAGPIEANFIAKWNGTAWSALGGTGIKNGGVYALALLGDSLYVGGSFTNFNDDTAAHYIATYDTTSQVWSPLTSSGKEGVYGGNVNALAVNGTQVYVGGWFTGVGFGTPQGPYTKYFAIWDSNSNTWTTQTAPGLNRSVDALAVHGTDVYLGGSFWGSGLEGLARWDTTAVTVTAVTGSSANVHALAVSGDDLYVGGSFYERIKRLDTTTDTWLPMSGAVYGGVYGGIVYALAAHSDGVLYVGGDFTGAGGWNTNNMARYIPECDMWLPIGQQGVNARVLAIAAGDTQIYSGGKFSLAYPAGGNLPSARLANFPHQAVNCSRSYLPVTIKPNP